MEENQCPCGKLFVNREDLNSHITAEHKPNNWNCSKCDKIYDRRGALYKHFRDKHQGLFQYNCQSCDYGNDDCMSFAHHVFKKHGGVEIEGIVKCPNSKSLLSESLSSLLSLASFLFVGLCLCVGLVLLKLGGILCHFFGRD